MLCSHKAVLSVVFHLHSRVLCSVSIVTVVLCVIVMCVAVVCVAVAVCIGIVVFVVPCVV